MRSITSLFSVQSFILALAFISALVTAAAIPVHSDYITLARRNPAHTVVIEGKVAVLGRPLTRPSHTKSIVYEITNWDNNPSVKAVLKTYLTKDRKVQDREIEALKAVGQYILSDKEHVVMRKVEGRPLAELVAETHNREERKTLVNKWRKKVAERAAYIAKTKGILHIDLHLNNILIHNDEVRLIDWDRTIRRGEAGFTDDVNKLLEKDVKDWDSSNTPPLDRPSSSPRSASRPGSPNSPSRQSGSSKSSSSSQKSASPKLPSRSLPATNVGALHRIF